MKKINNKTKRKLRNRKKLKSWLFLRMVTSGLLFPRIHILCLVIIGIRAVTVVIGGLFGWKRWLELPLLNIVPGRFFWGPLYMIAYISIFLFARRSAPIALLYLDQWIMKLQLNMFLCLRKRCFHLTPITIGQSGMNAEVATGNPARIFGYTRARPA